MNKEYSVYMKKNIYTLIILTILVSCSKKESLNTEDKVNGEDPYITEQIFKINTDVEPPQFNLKNIDGEIVSINDFKGKVLFLNFWASWCGPCVHEMPSIARLNDYYKDDDSVDVVLINLGEDRETVKSFLEEGGYNIETLLDKDNKVGTMYGVRSIPTTLIFNKEGKVVASKTGAHEWDREGVKNILDSLK